MATGDRELHGGVRLHCETRTANPDGRSTAEIALDRRRARLELRSAGPRRRGNRGHDDGRIVVDDYQRTTVQGVFALGDVSSEWELKHVANHEARIVQHNLKHPDAMMQADHRFVPHAVFSEPQVASVGKTERELVEAGTAVRVEDPAVRRRGLRLGDGGHHRLRARCWPTRRPARSSALICSARTRPA
jgi:hypothetical protein